MSVVGAGAPSPTSPRGSAAAAGRSSPPPTGTSAATSGTSPTERRWPASRAPSQARRPAHPPQRRSAGLRPQEQTMAVTDTATSTPTRHLVTLIYEGGEDISDMEVCDPVSITDTLEQVHVGGGGVLHGAYLRLSGPDLVVAAQELHRL